MRATILSAARITVAIALLVVLSVSKLPAADPAAQPAADQQKLTAAEDRVRAALLAETIGDAPRRTEALKQALDLVPNLPTAHWHVGEIERDGRWLSVQAAEEEATRAGKMAEYRQLRDQIAAPTFADHIRLARWAEKARLKEQQRAHYMLVLQMNSDCPEAISKLGLIWFESEHSVKLNGNYVGQPHFESELIERSAYESHRSRLKQATANAANWNPRLNRLRTRFDGRPSEREKVLSEVRSLQDLTAISSMEKILLTGNADLARAAIDALAENPHQSATESLVRTAVFNDDETVRQAAATALKHRPQHTYLPLLMAGLQMPLYGQFADLGVDGNHIFSRLILYQEGPTSRQVRVINRDLNLASKNNPPVSIAPSVNHLQGKNFERDLALQNEMYQAQNERVYAVLATATGAKVDASPDKWWDWWYISNDYYMPPQKNDDYYEVQHTPTVRVSCFVRGTRVWTTTGPMSIEKIKPGESVLAQNEETGELTYKPVLATTRRPTSPVLKVRVGNTEIRSTRGHPFWVCGIGWQMTKELKAGQYLHTVTGPQKVDSVEPVTEDDCFNLIVADFHNYFISDAKVLVHDNTLRGSLVARVPGLVE
jgi:hypothetical protein